MDSGYCKATGAALQRQLMRCRPGAVWCGRVMLLFAGLHLDAHVHDMWQGSARHYMEELHAGLLAFSQIKVRSLLCETVYSHSFSRELLSGRTGLYGYGVAAGVGRIGEQNLPHHVQTLIGECRCHAQFYVHGVVALGKCGREFKGDGVVAVPAVYVNVGITVPKRITGAATCQQQCR